MTLRFAVPDPDAMEVLGARLAQACSGPALITLQGDLGAGKTTFVRGMLRGIGHQGKVKSPTYTIVEPYEIGARRVYHFDLYRLCSATELDDIGLRDYLDDEALCVVEWPERGGGRLPVADIQIALEYADIGRIVTLAAQTDCGQILLDAIARGVS